MLKRYLVAFLLFSATLTATAQTTSQLEMLNTADVASLTDEQVQSYWQQIKASGYSLDQLILLAKSRGVDTSKLVAFRSRLSLLNAGSTIQDEWGLATIDSLGFVQNSAVPKKQKDDPYFGYDFFNKETITFNPQYYGSVPQDYVLGPGDELQIDFWGAVEKSIRIRLDRNGNFYIKGVGTIIINGLKLAQAKQKLSRYLARIYQGLKLPKEDVRHTDFDVSITKVRTVQVNIIGEVATPGTYQLSALSKVINALYACGGPTKNGTFRSIKLVRGGLPVATFDIYQFLTEGVAKGNLYLQDGDIIIVKPYRKLVSISGAVKREGSYQLKPKEHFGDLKDFFGGFSADAYKERFSLIRFTDKEKTVKDVAFNEYENFVLKDGDSITIGAVADRFKNRLTISGAVYRPGDYAFKEGMTLKDLLAKVDGFKKEAFMERAILTREIDETDRKMMSFAPKDVLNGDFDLKLQSNDSIKVYTKEELKEAHTVTVNGAVNKAGEYPYVTDMTLADVLLLASGFKDGVDTSNLSIARVIEDDDSNTISEVFEVSLDSLRQTKKPFYLKPYDAVSVRYLEGYTKQKIIKVGGAVKFPGAYALKNQEETLLDLLKKAGGLTQYAYAQGAYLLRKNTATKGIKNILNDSISTVLEIEQKKLAIDLPKIVAGKQKSPTLEEGDYLFIPKLNQTIQVLGEVFNEELIVFNPNYSFKDYIGGAGGYTSEAKYGKSYVIYANGSIKATKRFLWFKFYPKIKMGASIVIPKKIRKSNPQRITNSLAIATSLMTLAVLTRQLAR